jgi:hypothetical protein
MTPEKLERLKACLKEAANILYEQTTEEMHSLEEIERVVRHHLLDQVGPEIGHFLSSKLPTPSKAEPASQKLHWEIEHSSATVPAAGIESLSASESIAREMLLTPERQ